MRQNSHFLLFILLSCSSLYSMDDEVVVNKEPSAIPAENAERVVQNGGIVPPSGSVLRLSLVERAPEDGEVTESEADSSATEGLTPREERDASIAFTEWHLPDQDGKKTFTKVPFAELAPGAVLNEVIAAVFCAKFCKMPINVRGTALVVRFIGKSKCPWLFDIYNMQCAQIEKQNGRRIEVIDDKIKMAANLDLFALAVTFATINHLKSDLPILPRIRGMLLTSIETGLIKVKTATGKGKREEIVNVPIIVFEFLGQDGAQKWNSFFPLAKTEVIANSDVHPFANDQAELKMILQTKFQIDNLLSNPNVLTKYDVLKGMRVAGPNGADIKLSPAISTDNIPARLIAAFASGINPGRAITYCGNIMQLAASPIELDSFTASSAYFWISVQDILAQEKVWPIESKDFLGVLQAINEFDPKA